MWVAQKSTQVCWHKPDNVTRRSDLGRLSAIILQNRKKIHTTATVRPRIHYSTRRFHTVTSHCAACAKPNRWCPVAMFGPVCSRSHMLTRRCSLGRLFSRGFPHTNGQAWRGAFDRQVLFACETYVYNVGLCCLRASINICTYRVTCTKFVRVNARRQTSGGHLGRTHV
jgi:hypothetical protein